MGEFWLFVRAVANHWATLVTGGLIMAVLAVYERWQDQNIPRWSFWLLISAFLFRAFSLAWRDQHRARSDSEARVAALTTELAHEQDRNHPRLMGRIEQAGVGDAAFGLGAMVEMTVTNTGTPSIAVNWELAINTAPTIRVAALALPAGNFTFAGNAAHVVVERGNTLNERTTTPVPSGGMANGWLFFSIGTTARPEIVRPGVIWTVSFTDVEGRRHSASMAMRGGGSDVMAYRPGTGVQVRPVPLEPAIGLIHDPAGCASCSTEGAEISRGEFEHSLWIGLRNRTERSLRDVQLKITNLRGSDGGSGGVALPLTLGGLGQLNPSGEGHTEHIKFVTYQVTHLGPMVLHSTPPQGCTRDDYDGTLQVQALDIVPIDVPFRLSSRGVFAALRLGS